MGTRTSSGLQDSTREGVADVCLLHVGGGQLINCIISHAVGFPLSWCYGGLLVDFEQASSIILIDKTWVHLDWSSPTPILHIHRLSIRWPILAEAWRFRKWNPREFWSKSLRGGDGERKARWKFYQICSPCLSSFVLEKALLGGVPGSSDSLVFPMILFINICYLQLAKGDFLVCS